MNLAVPQIEIILSVLCLIVATMCLYHARKIVNNVSDIIVGIGGLAVAVYVWDRQINPESNPEQDQIIGGDNIGGNKVGGDSIGADKFGGDKIGGDNYAGANFSGGTNIHIVSDMVAGIGGLAVAIYLWVKQRNPESNPNEKNTNKKR